MLSPAGAAPSLFARLAARAGGLPRDARDTLFLLVVIGWVILPQVGRLPVWCSLLAAGVLLWRAALALTGRPLPRTRWVVVLLALTVVATFLTYRTLLGRDAGVTLVVVLLALKTLELRARRDAFVVFFLAFFTMLSNFFFSQSLLVAMAMLVGLLGLLTALVNAHLPVGRPPLLLAARQAGWMALLGAPIMAVLFVLFPRVAPLWGIPSDAMAGRSGLSSNMEVGSMASLVLDESIAMRIRFEGGPPPQSELYFRGPVLSDFDGRQWRALGQRPGAVLPAVAFQAPPSLTPLGTPVRYEVTLEPSNRPWLLVLDAAARPPEVPGAQPIATAELQWLVNQPVTDLLRYRAESHLRYQLGPAGASAAVLAPQYRELPPGFDPRTRALAAELMRTTAAEGKAALVQAALDRLRTGGYTYTLEPGVYGQHTADEFWFDRREGFCEHIASAFVVLMRAMEIPARVVTGYQGGERNPVDGFWTIRQADAHAWVEVWLAGQGWVRVDPTSAVAPARTGSFQRLAPPRGVLATAIGNVNPTLLAGLRSAWEAVNNRWNQWILNYTQSRQLNLLKDIGFESPSWEDLSYLLIGIITSVAALGALWAWWERSQHDPWLRLLARARRRLRQAGLALAATAPPRHMADAVRQRFGAQGQAVVDWLLALEAQRYGPAVAEPAGARQARFVALRRQYRALPWPTA